MEMFDKLEDIVNRYEDITAELSNPDVVNDQDRFRKLMKEQNNILPIVTAFTEYKDCKKNIEDSLAMLSEESDEELLELAKEELNESKKRVEELENELKILLLPKDPNDDKDIIVEIRAGAGGDEAALFAAELFRMYTHYVESRGWKIEVVNADETGIGGMKEVEFMVKGQGAYSVMKYESGVHRVQRVPETESGGRIHTSTASVAVMPEAEEVDIKIDEKDIRIDVMRASGNGGQCVNTTDSAVRLIILQELLFIHRLKNHRFRTRKKLLHYCVQNYMIWNVRKHMMLKLMQEEARLVQVTVLRKSEHTISHRDVLQTTESVLHYTNSIKLWMATFRRLSMHVL